LHRATRGVNGARENILFGARVLEKAD